MIKRKIYLHVHTVVFTLSLPPSVVPPSLHHSYRPLASPPLSLCIAGMLKRVDLLCKELKDLEAKAKDTRLKGEEITKIIAELEASIAKYKEEYSMLISDANIIKNDLTTVEKVRREREGERKRKRERESGGRGRWRV